jgi:predicted metal-dependent hydrolase
MIQIKKENDKIILSITTQLDREDVYEIVSDLNKWLEDTLPYTEAKAQNDSKNKLSLEMQKVIEEAFSDTYYVTSNGKAIKKDKYDIAPSEIQLEQLKTKKNAK